MATIREALAIAREHGRSGRFDLAELVLWRIVEAEPGHVEAWNELGIALQEQGNLAQAVRCWQESLRVDAEFVDALSNLGLALGRQGRLEEAAACLERAIAMRPDSADSHYRLALVQAECGKIEEAIAGCRRAVALQPQHLEAYGTLTYWLHRVPRLDEALVCCRRAIDAHPNLAAVGSSYLCLLRYQPGVRLAAVQAAHAEFEQRHAAPLRGEWQTHVNTRLPERPLRLGFVAPAFVRVPLGAFLWPVFGALDRRQFATVCYAEEWSRDPVSTRFRAAAGGWRTVTGLSDAQLAAQIRHDQIDILFDLAGHARRNRLLAFARRPAPVQVTWIDSVGTTGLAAMDYVLADRHTIPVDAEAYYAERVLRMADGYVCFEPPAEAPPVGPLPAAEQGYVTFGSFSNPAKLNPQVIELWCRILRQVPGARLVLKYGGIENAVSRNEFGRQFAQHGVTPDRVEMLGHSSYREYLGEYRRIDIALDPFPHAGGLTTCDALWMGVPVVTWPGETFASRQSLSHLATVGLSGTVAQTADDYVRRAVEWANNLARLADTRCRLRAQMAASPLCDAPRFARQLMELLREVWRRWCAKGT